MQRSEVKYPVCNVYGGIRNEEASIVIVAIGDVLLA